MDDSSPDKSEKSNSSSECFRSLPLSLSDRDPVSSFLDAFLLDPTSLSLFFFALRHHGKGLAQCLLLFVVGGFCVRMVFRVHDVR